MKEGKERKKWVESHGPVKYTTCSRLWNRDTNAANNNRKIARNSLDGLAGLLSPAKSISRLFIVNNLCFRGVKTHVAQGSAWQGQHTIDTATLYICS